MSQSPKDERRLLRLLHGEVDAAEAVRLRREIARDPALRAAWEGLEGTWRSLAAPPVEPPGPGLSGRVMARVRELPPHVPGWPSLGWRRLAATSALGLGLLLGLGLGGEPATREEAGEAWLAEPDSLAAGYWLALTEEEPLADEEDWP